MLSIRHRFPTFFALCSLVLPTAADEPETQTGPEAHARHFESKGEIEIDGRVRHYTAVAATTYLRDEEGEPEAEFFSISYFANEDPDTHRPITFAFNGGPGSCSVWLHMGLLGPKRVEVPSDGQAAGAPPYPLVDNADTLLGVTDLVFVDPIGTGLSRVVGEGSTEDHWGVDEDARSVARFIRRFLTENGRWASPKYVLGESYGGIRGPLLVRELQGGFDSVALNGLILISPALQAGIVDGQDNDAAYATVIPTYAATAWYHGALPEQPADFEAFLEEVRTWVAEEYVPALFLGRDLTEERRESIVDGLHRYTGLSKEYLRRANLKVSTDRFRRELLRDRGLIVGRLDTRYTGTEADDVGETPTGDPLGSGIAGAYVAGFKAYMSSTLGVESRREYVIMSGEAAQNWKPATSDFPAFGGYVDVAPALARGMADNPDLRVFIGNGYYDIATTFFGAEYNVRRSTMDRDRVTIRNYPAGHMMYVHHPTLSEMARDLKAFYAAPIGR